MKAAIVGQHYVRRRLAPHLPRQRSFIFGTALLLSALLRPPWQTITIAAALWGLMGLRGVAFAVIIARRMRRQAVYQPGFEDWSFHVALPLAAFAIIALSSFAASLLKKDVSVDLEPIGIIMVTAVALIRKYSQRSARRVSSSA
jgi:ABC-type transport system involved in multi-copper enzyme maturation permease subunit